MSAKDLKAPEAGKSNEGISDTKSFLIVLMGIGFEDIPDTFGDMESIQANGFLYGNDVVILDCPICHASHLHGNPKPGYGIGDITYRAPHCVTSYRYNDLMIIIKGELTQAQFTGAMRRLSKPRKARR